MILNILQWNILRRENPDNIISLINKIGPDIICAQELIENKETGIDVSKYISKKLNFNYFFKEGDTWSPPKNNKTSQGNAIFSRFPILKTRFEYLSPPHHNPPDANFEGRVYVETKVQIKNRLLTVGTTHLSFSPRFIITERRIKETDNLIASIKNNKESFIFSGDLNCPPTSYVVEQLEKHFVHAGPNYDEPTWTTKPFNYHGQFIEDKLRWRLDYFFTSSDIQVVKSKIVKTEYSDHLPILIAISL